MKVESHKICLKNIKFTDVELENFGAFKCPKGETKPFKCWRQKMNPEDQNQLWMTYAG